MFTIFTIPKPFTDPHIRIIQRNAIQSWKKLEPECEILLLGDDEGIATTAKKYDISHIPEMACNKYGTPLLDSAFSLARKHARYDVLVFINTDIITLPDFTSVVHYLPESNYLVAGQRFDLDIREKIDYNTTDWGKKILAKTRNIKRHPPNGSDYFLFKRALFDDIPEFAVGRVGWDNWMLHNAQKNKIMTIDATRVITIIHQNHDYSHHLFKKMDRTNDPETLENLRIGRKAGFLYLDETDFYFNQQGVLRQRFFIQKAKIRRGIKRFFFKSAFVRKRWTF